MVRGDKDSHDFQCIFDYFAWFYWHWRYGIGSHARAGMGGSCVDCRNDLVGELAVDP